MGIGNWRSKFPFRKGTFVDENMGEFLLLKDEIWTVEHIDRNGLAHGGWHRLKKPIDGRAAGTGWLLDGWAESPGDPVSSVAVSADGERFELGGYLRERGYDPNADYLCVRYGYTRPKRDRWLGSVENAYFRLCGRHLAREFGVSVEDGAAFARDVDCNYGMPCYRMLFMELTPSCLRVYDKVRDSYVGEEKLRKSLEAYVKWLHDGGQDD